MPMNNFGEVCGFCQSPVGVGKGKRTAARFTNVTVRLNPPNAPQLRGLVVKCEVLFCLQCLEVNTNVLMKAQVASHTQPAKPTN